MKFIMIPIIDKDGKENIRPINPDNVIWLEPTLMPTGLASTEGGRPIMKSGTGIIFIGGVGRACSLSEKEVIELLEGTRNAAEETQD